MTRTRPTMDDWREAQDFRYYRAHAGQFQHVEGERWLIYDSDASTQEIAEIEGLSSAIHAHRQFKATPAPAVTEESSAAREARGQDG